MTRAPTIPRPAKRILGGDPAKRFKLTSNVLYIMRTLYRIHLFLSADEVKQLVTKARVVPYVLRHLEAMARQGYVEKQWNINTRLWTYALTDHGRAVYLLNRLDETPKGPKPDA